MHRFKKRSHRNIIGLTLSGKLTKEEYEEIVPLLEEKIHEYGKIRLMIELDHWEGWGPYAALKDVFFVFKNSFNIERVAFMIRSKDDRRAVLLDQPFSPWFRDNTRYFSEDEKEAAWGWVGEGIEGFELGKIADTEDEATLAQQKKKRKVRYGPKMKVLIVGGGVSGITLAALLQQRGFEPRVVEARKVMQDSEKMMFLWPTASGIIKSLSSFKKLIKNGIEVKGVGVYDVNEVLLRRYDHDFLSEKHGPLYAIPQGKLIRLLTKVILPNVLRMGVAATKLKETDEGVKVNFSDGTKGIYDCVICADGVHSKMRELIFGAGEVAEYAEMIGWAFSVEPKDFDMPESSYMYRGKEGCIRFFPIGDRLYVWAAINSKQPPTNGNKQLDVMKEYFKNYPGITPKVVDLIEDEAQVSFSGFYQLDRKNRVKGRVGLLGDSGYCFLPPSLLGDTMMLESAYVLAEELCRSDSDRVQRALVKYQHRRDLRFDSVKKEMKKYDMKTYSQAKALAKVKDFSQTLMPYEQYQEFWSWLNDQLI